MGNASNNVVIENCTNYGKIKINGNCKTVFEGEIFGGASDYTVVQINNCKNEGNIEKGGTEDIVADIYVGGIVGYKD